MAGNKLYLSNSNIQIFMNCKRKFKYKYIDRISSKGQLSSKFLSFGNSIHATLAQFNAITSNEYRTLDNLHKLLRRNWKREGYESIEEEREYGLKALDMLTNYFNEPKDQGKQNLILEEMIKQDVGGRFVLTGKLDKVYLRDDSLIETIDYKTGNTIEPLSLLQLPIYILLTKAKLGRYPDIVSYYYLSYNEKTEVKVTKELINEVIQTIEDIYYQIFTEKEFLCNPNEYCRMNCEYFENCDDARDSNSIVISIINSLNKEENGNMVF